MINNRKCRGIFIQDLLYDIDNYNIEDIYEKFKLLKESM